MIIERYRQLPSSPRWRWFRAAANAQTADTIRIGYQKYSTLTAILKTNGELEKALAPLGVRVSWHEFTSGLPLLEAINTGNIDFGADVADRVPLFAQAAGAKLAYIAEETASPSAQAILVSAESPIKTVADLKGRKVAVTKGAGSHFLLLAALAKAGLSFKDIRRPTSRRRRPRRLHRRQCRCLGRLDPFLTSAQRQSNARILSDGSNGLASYKRYYLSSAAFADRRGDVLNVIFGKLDETGKWVKAHPKDAASLLAGLWGIDAATVQEANSHRSYRVGVVTPQVFRNSSDCRLVLWRGMLPVKVSAGDAQSGRRSATDLLPVLLRPSSREAVGGVGDGGLPQTPLAASTPIGPHARPLPATRKGARRAGSERYRA